MKKTIFIDQALDVLRQGGIVAFPTETSYGLGACIDFVEALERIFFIKKRERTKPLLVLVSEISDLEELVRFVPECAKALMERFWPGPLTLLFPVRPGLPRPLSGATGKIGIRISSDKWARALVRGLGRPITATSANLSGRPPAHTPEEVAAQLADSLPDILLDGGPTGGMLPSTIVDVSSGTPAVVRQGVISQEDIAVLRGTETA